MNRTPTTETFNVAAPNWATGVHQATVCHCPLRSRRGDESDVLPPHVVSYGLVVSHISAQENVIGLVDNDQEVSTVYLQDSWGIPLVDTDCQTVSLASSPIQVESVPNPYRWGGAWGYYWDEDVGMYLLGLRWYESFTGRFLTKDPIRFASCDANLYRYVENNPLNATDPLGLQQIIKRDDPVFHGQIGNVKRCIFGESTGATWDDDIVTPLMYKGVKEGIALMYSNVLLQQFFECQRHGNYEGTVRLFRQREYQQTPRGGLEYRDVYYAEVLYFRAYDGTPAPRVEINPDYPKNKKTEKVVLGETDWHPVIENRK